MTWLCHPRREDCGARHLCPGYRWRLCLVRLAIGLRLLFDFIRDRSKQRTHSLMVEFRPPGRW